MSNPSTSLEVNDLTSLLNFTPNGFANKVIFQDELSKAVLFAFEPEQGLAAHTAPCPIAIHFLSGKATLIIDGVQHTTGPHSYFRLPAKLEHSVQAHESTHMLLTLFKQATNIAS